MNTAPGCRVTLVAATRPSVSFVCPPRMSVLRAAKNAGYALSAGCMQGRCYTCRSQLLSGKVSNSRSLSRYATVDPADLGGSRVLLCSVTPTEDITVRPDGPWEPASVQHRGQS